MKIILRTDMPELGKRGDIIEVADGYARNFLLPRGSAIVASPGAVEQAAAMRRSRDVKDARDRGAAEDIARQLVPKVVNLTARAGTEGRLFGSITASDIAEAVLEQTGLEIDRRRMQLDEPIRSLGTHRVMVRLHPEVEFPVTIEVAAG